MSDPLMKLDGLSEKFWSRVLSLLCGLTGRSNFFFARLFGGVGGGVMAILEFILAAYDVRELSFFAIFEFSLLFLFGYLTRMVFRLAKRLEAGLESGEFQLSLLYKDLKRLFIARTFGTILVVLGFISGDWFLNSFQLLLVGSLYFLTDFRPKGTSKTRKLVEAAWKKLSTVRLPTPSPSPAPSPVPS